MTRDLATLDAFEQDQRRRGLATKTIQARGTTLRALYLWARPNHLVRLGPATLERWLASCSLGPRGRAAYIATLGAFYSYCVRAGLRRDNPAEKLGRPRLPRSLPRPIADTDLMLALERADPRMRAWLALAAFEGLRCFEIVQVTREDVQDTRRPRPVLIVQHGKGDRERILPLHPEAWEALRLYGLPAAGLVFHHDDGRAFLPGTVSAYINRHLRGLGIDATAHQARHWYGSSLYQNTRDLRMTQELMGHASPTTTAGYAAWSPDAAADAVDSLRLGAWTLIGREPEAGAGTSSDIAAAP